MVRVAIPRWACDVCRASADRVLPVTEARTGTLLPHADCQCTLLANRAHPDSLDAAASRGRAAHGLGRAGDFFFWLPEVHSIAEGYCGCTYVEDHSYTGYLAWRESST
jgi:hypothetical protein